MLPNSRSTEDQCPLLPLSPSSSTGRGCHRGQGRAGGEQCEAGHGGCICPLPGLRYPPPRHHYGLLSYPCSSGLRLSLPLPSCLLTCLSPAGTRRCPQLLPAHLHADTRLFLGAGNNGNRREEDFWGRCVWSRGRHRLFVMPSSFSEGRSACLPSLWDRQCPSAPALTVLLPGPIYTALPGLYPPLQQGQFRHLLALRLLSAGQSARVL